MLSLSEINPGNKLSKEGKELGREGVLRQEWESVFNLPYILSTLSDNKKGMLVGRNSKGT